MLDDKIKNMTDEPGVYLMKSDRGEILYVGKAKNLKARVSSYFQKQKKPPRIELLVHKIKDIEVVITDTEVEALILECNLIKKHKPRFNVSLKDDKTYPYVRLALNHPYPRVEYTRKLRKDGARYFGPYVSAYQIKDLLRWATKAFQLRDCSDNEFRNRSRPCILFQMKQCSAPCVGNIDEEAYDHSIKSVLKLLDGKTNELIRELKKEMKEASKNEEFEMAASLRDRISHLEHLAEEQKISDPESTLDRDVIHYARDKEMAVIVIMAVRDGRTVGVLQFPFLSLEPSISDEEFLFEFMAQYYLNRSEAAPKLLPEEILMPEIMKSSKEVLVLEKALGKDIEIHVPKRGQSADLIQMVRKTAEFHLQELGTRTANFVNDLNDVKKQLKLLKFPRRLECFDISHFQGKGTTASRVVFIDGRPDKKLYRHYHVKSIDGPDDFKSLREVLERRFLNDNELPDLVIIDGGKGQLSQAVQIFEELDVAGVDLVSIAKARTEASFKDKDVKATMERIFKPNQKNPIMLKPGTGAHRVLTQARDESHRFAITFHRKVRSKQIFKKKT